MVSNWVIVGARLDSQFHFGPLNPLHTHTHTPFSQLAAFVFAAGLPVNRRPTRPPARPPPPFRQALRGFDRAVTNPRALVARRKAAAAGGIRGGGGAGLPRGQIVRHGREELDLGESPGLGGPGGFGRFAASPSG